MSANSYGESDYVIIPVFGWILYSTHSLSPVAGMNVSTFIMIGVTATIWFVLILDGQLETRKNKKDNPTFYYQHKLNNINEAKKHYQNIHKNKINFLDESIKKLAEKKTAYTNVKYRNKLAKLNQRKAIVNHKLTKQQNKMKVKLAVLKRHFAQQSLRLK
jgi:hypothetical protein